MLQFFPQTPGDSSLMLAHWGGNEITESLGALLTLSAHARVSLYVMLNFV